MEHIKHLQLTDIAPLSQPSSKEIGSLIKRGLVQRLEDRQTSPMETKQQKITERYIKERGTLAVVLTRTKRSSDMGPINVDAKNDINTFTISDRATQQRMHHEAISNVNAQLATIFEPNLMLRKELLAEGVTTPDVIEININFWNRIFKNASRRERVDIAVQLREGIQEILLERFPSYTLEWERILKETMGLSKEEANSQRIKLEESFANASNLGKVGISKTLREKILETSNVSFNLGISILRKLRAAKGITVDSEKFPDPSKLRALYQVSSFEGRIFIDNLIKDACDTLIARIKKSKRP